jgi:D-tyrosyl-tRNA(Tyr) deacylase
MRVVLQRAATADVRVSGDVVGAIDRTGLVILVGVTHNDTATDAARLAEKVWRLRIFDGEQSAEQLAAPMLVVSQFTLYAEIRKGRRPSWSAAAPRELSEPLVQSFVEALRALGAEVSTGIFGAHMQVQLVNDGPVTLILDSAG